MAMSKQQEAQQLLDDLDSFAVPPTGSGKGVGKAPAPGNEKEAAEALAFLDEITRKSTETRRSTPGPPPVTRVTLGGNRPGTPGSLTRKKPDSARASPKPDQAALVAPPSAAPAATVSGSWGWGNVWSSASAAIQQARNVVDEQVKNLPQNDQAKRLREGVMGYVKQAQLDKISSDLKNTSLTGLVSGIINAVAPPIAEHEVIQLSLSHDMEGYDGVETVVYRAMAKVLEQVDGSDLVVNKGNESRPKDPSSSTTRNLNAVDGFEQAVKLAEAEVAQLIKTVEANPPKEPSSIENPTTYTYVYLRIQPYTSTFPSLTTKKEANEEDEEEEEDTSRDKLQFVLHFTDPLHSLVHTSVTQAVPASWLDLWDADEKKGGLLTGAGRRNGEWIEDMLVDVLRLGVEVVGQEYLVARMGWDRDSDEEEEEEEGEEEEEEEEEAEEEKGKQPATSSQRK